jgi:hypothetical protein
VDAGHCRRFGLFGAEVECGIEKGNHWRVSDALGLYIVEYLELVIALLSSTFTLCDFVSHCCVRWSGQVFPWLRDVPARLMSLQVNSRSANATFTYLYIRTFEYSLLHVTPTTSTFFTNGRQHNPAWSEYVITPTCDVTTRPATADI